MPTSFTKEDKPGGGGGNASLNWNDMTESWDEVTGTWDAPRSTNATGFTKETKPTTSFTNESKP